jgi:hypothetical protein
MVQNWCTQSPSSSTPVLHFSQLSLSTSASGNLMMKMQWLTLTGVTLTLISMTPLTSLQPAQAQPIGCIYLREVTTGRTSIEKQASIEGLGDNNWNTDFAVPAGMRFSYFIGRVYPQNNANYRVTINLKYPNDTASEVFQKEVPMQRFRLFSKNFWSPTARQPYQVNMNVGSAVNNAYSVAVLACR